HNQETFAREKKAHEELRRVQEELIRAAKLSTIGELLASVAHEINNPVAAIVGFTELCAADDRCPPPLRADVERIRQGAIRVKRLAEQLRVLSEHAPEAAAAGSFDVERLVREALAPRLPELERKRVA